MPRPPDLQPARALPDVAPPATDVPKADAGGAPTPPGREPAWSGPAPIDSGALLQGRTEVRIAHRGVLYRLRETALGKLILTK